MKAVYTLLAFYLMLGLTGCSDHQGIRYLEVAFDTLPFDRIRLETSADVKIIQSNTPRVIIRGEERDINDISVRVINDRLTLEERGQHPDDLEIEVYVAEISQLECPGSSLIYGESYFTQNRNMDINMSGSGELDFAIDTDDLDVELSGSGYIYLEGVLQTLDAEISGSGWVRSFNLETDLADVRIEGSGSAEVFVNTDLDVFISGSGNVYYKGHPSIHADITGSGEIINAN